MEEDMDLKLKGKTALVTGASAGIGRAIAKGLAAEGVRVCIAARRAALLEQLSEEISSKSCEEPVIVTVDLLQPDEPARLARVATEKLGRIDILVNAAGGSEEGEWMAAPDERWEQTMTLNFTQIRRLTLAVVPEMIRQSWGRIINITGKAEPAKLLGVHPAKSAVHNFAKGLSREVAKHNVTVNSIPPGKIMSEQIRRKYSEEYQKNFSASDIPVGRFGEPEELAYLAICLASPLASYITGNVIHVDGGQHRFAF
jgi:3-oxoacyl-[acyl-carrier protein] reductase